MCIIAVANQKGGTGKTTTCVNLGIGLARTGKKVLLVDADAQGSMAVSLGVVEPDNLDHTIVSIMEKVINDESIDDNEGIMHHEEGVDFIPANIELAGLETALVGVMSREFVLKSYLDHMKDKYDYILIDAPPTLGGWVMNILCASDKVVIPVEASPWGMFGLANMFEFLNEVKQITPELEVAGIAVTKVDTRKSYYKQTMETLHELEDIHVFEQIIRVDSSVEWSQDNSIPVVEYKKSSRSAREYTRLAEEVMELCQ